MVQESALGRLRHRAEGDLQRCLRLHIGEFCPILLQKDGQSKSSCQSCQLGGLSSVQAAAVPVADHQLQLSS